MIADDASTIEDVDATAVPKRVVRVPLGALVWGAIVVASVLLLVALFYYVQRPDHATNDTAQQSAKTAARDGVVAVYTYSADTLDRDIASAQSHLTGDFLSEFKQYAQSPAPNETKQNAVKTTASVAAAAVMDMHPDTADVLLFINQTTTSAQNPATTMASRSVVAKLVKVDGKWLISSLKPA